MWQQKTNEAKDKLGEMEKCYLQDDKVEALWLYNGTLDLATWESLTRTVMTEP